MWNAREKSEYFFRDILPEEYFTDEAVKRREVTNIAKRGKKCIRICFLAKRDYVDLEADNEEELDRIWEKLTGVC